MVSNQSISIDILKNSLRSAQMLRHRVLLVLPGDAAEAVPRVMALLDDLGIETATLPSISKTLTSRQYQSGVLHLPDRHSNSDSADQINALLGSEFKCIFFDTNDVFDERLFAACTGTIVGGGLLVLQTPSLKEWGMHHLTNRNASNFILRFVRKIKEHQKVILFNSEDSITDNTIDAAFLITSSYSATDTSLRVPTTNAQSQIETQSLSKAPPSSTSSDWQAEQTQLIDQLVDNILGNSESTIVVQADRGRGKSALIGLALTRLLSATTQSELKITITASRQNACRVLLRHASHTGVNEQLIRFVPIDLALQEKHDLLIVEEAGNIPIPMLTKLTELSNKIIFATTVQGYEGAGRGFALRFAKQLDTVKPGWIKLQPTHPIRWSPNDPLEAFVNDALLLKTSLDLNVRPEKLSTQQSVVSQISKHELSTNDAVVEDIYALLIQAHYQTTPADLRNLMDQELMLVFAQYTNNVLTGAALVALEGGIESDLHEAVVKKERRLPDQLLPQLLAQSAAEKNVLGLNYSRIVRIAIHPQCQRRGFGTALFEALRLQLRSFKSTIGTSFGADNQSISFWLKLGLTPIHYGYKVNARSGVKSACLMLENKSETAPAIAKARSILHMNLNALLEQNSSDDAVGKQLLHASNRADKLVTAQMRKSLLSDFCHSQRSFIDTVGLIELDETVAPPHSVTKHLRELMQEHNRLSPKQRRAAEQALRDYLTEQTR